MLLLLLTISLFQSVNGEDCGPLGFEATTLLSPAYWFLDLPASQCLPLIYHSEIEVSNDTEPICRIYFNLCKTLIYQCAGTVCFRYLKTSDLIIRLGEYKNEPFIEATDKFQVSFTGEKVRCANGPANIKTSIHFNCNNQSVWIRNNTKEHGGVEAPAPTSVVFNKATCNYDIFFDYNEACRVIPRDEEPSHSISNGSLILILFFPGVLLYFILGCLFNKMRGHSGLELIPQYSFWSDLPDLIMDGFMFTMGTLTCRHDNKILREYEPVTE